MYYRNTKIEFLRFIFAIFIMTYHYGNYVNVWGGVDWKEWILGS